MRCHLQLFIDAVEGDDIIVIIETDAPSDPHIGNGIVRGFCILFHHQRHCAVSDRSSGQDVSSRISMVADCGKFTGDSLMTPGTDGQPGLKK